MDNENDSLVATNQPAEFWVGIEQFNQGEYYACHDTLEAIWMDAKTMNKGFYQGILQIAVGLYHLTNLNWQGAAILIGEGIHRLNGYEDNYGGIDIADLVNQANDWLAALQQSGPEHVQQIAAILLPLATDTQIAVSQHQLAIPKIQVG
ncbi:MAG: DUF309 domain-containing protein [Cyanobacteria bacterium P01_C01_bin.118]